MTKIKSYPIDNDITGSDKWIGTDGGGFNRTKNFTVTGLANHFNETRKIELSNSLSFKYDTVDVGDDRSIGSFSFENEIGATVPFSSISNLIFHKNTSNGKTVTNFMGGLSEAVVLIHRADNPNFHGFFKFKSYTQRIDDIDFYDVVLDFIHGNGSIEEDKFYFLSVVQLDVAADKNYVHNQSTASVTWNVQHNLNKFPSATMVLSTGQKGYGDVTYIDENNLTITFASAESGKAYIN
jgi:hypothetical protein